MNDKKLNYDSFIFKPERTDMLLLETTITALGFAEDSNEAKLIKQMVETFFVAGMNKASTLYTAALMGEVSLDDVLAELQGDNHDK